VGRGEADEGVDAAAAAGIGVGDAEDVGGCVACLGITEEDWSSGGRRYLGWVCGERPVVWVPGNG
jgi:hypothetical protein